MIIRTVCGYDFFEVSSAMQKAIRRADTGVAGFFALELWASGYRDYVWKRLFTISAEDCYGIITKEIEALWQGHELVNKTATEPKGRIFVSKAVILLCECRKNRDAVLPILKKLGIKYTELHPEQPFLWTMFERPVKKRGTNIIHKKGYSWCGGTCRWGTSEKLRALKAHTKDGIDYVGIAADETHRFEKEKRPNRVLPLRDWGITEADALQYCYTKGFVWHEDGVRLYELLDRVSCWCCGNKNLKELKNMYLYLPWYWKKLKELQLNTDRPYRRNSGETIFDLEERFRRELLKKKTD